MTLFRRYPATAMYLYEAGDFTPPDDDTALDPTKREDPTFTGTIGPDITFFGFAVAPADLGKYWVVLEDPPTGYRFYAAEQNIEVEDEPPAGTPRSRRPCRRLRLLPLRRPGARPDRTAAVTTVEVLVPLRLETRFVAPQDRLDGVPEWQLRLRVWPDDVSIRRTVPPPSPAELDRLAEVTEGGKDRWWFAWRNNGTARGITVGKFSTPEEAMAATDEAG